MDQDNVEIIDALYKIEGQRLQRNDFDVWTTPAEVAAALPHSHPHYQWGCDTWEFSLLSFLKQF